MKKMKSFMAGLLGAVLLCGALSLTACGDSITGTVYSLEKAYENGYLTKEDLEQIAYYRENPQERPNLLDSRIDLAIREAYAEDTRTDPYWANKEITADGFKIEEYYGVYADCYVFSMRSYYWEYPTSVGGEVINIGGVEFFDSYWGPFIEVWKMN